MESNEVKCFACNRQLKGTPRIADTRDCQTVFVGPECYKAIRSAGETGYQPPLGGPRLWPLRCICLGEGECDCERFPTHVSEECPTHNLYPKANPNCSAHCPICGTVETPKGCPSCDEAARRNYESARF